MISDAPEFSDPVQDDVEVSLLLENFDIPDMKIILEHDNTISGINSIDRKQLQYALHFDVLD